MPAEVDQFYANKPYLLTLKGQVTIYFIDGQTLTGEITAQDTFNVFLSIEGVPHLISRSQIRYIKGEPGQVIEVDAGSASVSEALPMPAPALPVIPPPPEPATASTSISKASPLPPPPPTVTPPPPEPAAEMAFFVEEEEPAPPEEDAGGTLVIPPLTPAMTEMGQGQSAADALEESGKTIILTPEAETSPEIAAPVSAGSSNLADLPEPDEDVTFVLTQDEEISAHLVCTTGPQAGEVFQLRPGITTIGRSSDNAVPLSRDKEVSRRHAIIAYEASKFVIQDQNSLNGTFVNNQPVKEPQPLEDGDIILIGVSTLKFQERA